MNENNDYLLDGINQINIAKKQRMKFGIVFLISWSISIILWFQVELDKSILILLNNSRFDEKFVLLNQLFSKYGMAVIVFTYLLYLILSFKINELRRGRPLFLLIICSFAVAGISGDILKEIFNRTRPIHEYASEIRGLTSSVSPSFPSGHATKSIAFVLPYLFCADYRGRIHSLVKYILSLIVLFVCFSRIILGAHYLSDVLAGLGWAFLCLPISIIISNSILRKMTNEKLEFAAKIWVLVYIGLLILLIKI
ncbi:MAG: phosphatase PAP2 family protein [Candidatus Kariarchaeaceae archaeon]